ncbi:ArsR/SmtB family transcription factor [Streptomyces sp. NPDC059076]|uniref:ArsR/SmtB family transcription factor n=1 Tax=unclassified Streptomyces TaxID=2593676 RepID=UPI0036BFD74D
MIRIRFTAADLARVRFAPRPAPLAELNAALMMMCHPHDQLLFGRWKERVLRSLPAAVSPLRDLVPTTRAPRFIDVFSDSLEGALETVRASPRSLVRSEIERVHANEGFAAPPWIHDLHRGDHRAWQVLHRAQHAAFETVVRPVWPLVQDLHQREFARHALTAAEHGVGAALAESVPGTRWHEDVWQLEGPERDITLRGHGLLLLPTFHWTGRPLMSQVPDQPLVVTFPAGPGLPLTPTGSQSADEALAGVIGRTRFNILLRSAEEHTTSELARLLGVSNATVSAHTTALRSAGLITTVRAGRAVLHQRTAVGTLLVQGREVLNKGAG